MPPGSLDTDEGTHGGGPGAFAWWYRGRVVGSWNLLEYLAVAERWKPDVGSETLVFTREMAEYPRSCGRSFESRIVVLLAALAHADSTTVMNGRSSTVRSLRRLALLYALFPVVQAPVLGCAQRPHTSGRRSLSEAARVLGLRPGGSGTGLHVSLGPGRSPKSCCQPSRTVPTTPCSSSNCTQCRCRAAPTGPNFF